MNSKKFDFSNVDDFDNHIKLSIPNFETLDTIFSSITKEFAQPESYVLDLGCSTGRYLHNLDKIEDTNYIGFDIVNFKNRRDGFEYQNLDIEQALTKYLDENVSAIVCMFMLQFLGKAKRERVVNLLKKYVDKGTIILLSEKVYLEDTRLQTLLHRLHIQEKRKNFSDKEILDKDNQLSVSMFCKTQKELDKELNIIGDTTKIWQSYNFMGYCIKSHWLYKS
jgi:tRNA (cmo5U34)-methyltransferase